MMISWVSLFLINIGWDDSGIVELVIEVLFRLKL